jgi:hypothetical protein
VKAGRSDTDDYEDPGQPGNTKLSICTAVTSDQDGRDGEVREV